MLGSALRRVATRLCSFPSPSSSFLIFNNSTNPNSTSGRLFHLPHFYLFSTTVTVPAAHETSILRSTRDKLGGGRRARRARRPVRHRFVEKSSGNVTTNTYAAIELALDSVVKVFTVSRSPNYFLPWQNKSQRETTGSGFSFSPFSSCEFEFLLYIVHGMHIKHMKLQLDSEVLALGPTAS